MAALITSQFYHEIEFQSSKLNNQLTRPLPQVHSTRANLITYAFIYYPLGFFCMSRLAHAKAIWRK